MGHFPSEIVDFIKFSMKQVCKLKKKAILMLTLRIKSIVFLHNIYYCQVCKQNRNITTTMIRNYNEYWVPAAWNNHIG